MTVSMVTLETTILVENEEVLDILETFDGENGIVILHNSNACFSESKSLETNVLEIVNVKDDVEEVVYNKKAAISYYLSKNKSFKINDMIRLERCDYAIVSRRDEVFLFDANNLSVMSFNDVFTVEQLAVHLQQHHPSYQVLRRVV